MTSDMPRGCAKRGDGPIDATDQAVLATLRTALEHLDPVPPGLVERVAFAVALDEVWAEVAEITRMPVAMAGARSTVTTRQSMTFSAGGTTVVVVVAEDGAGTVRLDGWVTPGSPLTVLLRTPGGQRETTIEHGRFSFHDVPTGMVQLVVDGPTGNWPLITPTLDV